MKSAKNVRKSLQGARRQIERAVGADGRRRAIESGVRTAQSETYIASTELEARRTQYRRDIENWTNQRPSANIEPTPIESDLTKSRGYFIGGVAAAILEVFFASLLLIGFGVDWRIAFVVSAFVTALLVLVAHHAILFATRHASGRVTLSRIKAFVLWPAIVVTAPAIAIVLLVRTASGELVITLLPLLQAAMWLAAIGLILLGGALFAAADLLSWSAKAHAAYVDMLRVLMQAQNDLREYLDELGVAQPPAPPLPRPVPAPPPAQLPAATTRIVISLVALFLVGFATSACNKKDFPLTTQAATGPTQAGAAGDPVELHIELDHSGSPQEESWRTATRSLREQLPILVESVGATRLTFAYFSDDGWVPVERLSIELPRLQLPAVKKVGSAEGKMLPNVEQSVSEYNEHEQQSAIEKSRVTYRAEIRHALDGLSDDLFAFPSGRGSHCTELYGAYLRAASMAPGTKHVFVFLTDSYNSCGKFHAVQKPVGDVSVVTLLVAAGLGESKGVRSVDQFAERKEMLRQYVPWARVVPAFERNLALYVGKNLPAGP